MVHPPSFLKCLKVPSFHSSVGEPCLPPLNREGRDRGGDADFETSNFSPSMVVATNSSTLENLLSPGVKGAGKTALLIDEG